MQKLSIRDKIGLVFLAGVLVLWAVFFVPWHGQMAKPLTIHEAAFEGDGVRVAELIRKGASPDVLSREGLPPMWYALVNRNYITAHELMERGANINVRTGNGRTMLYRFECGEFAPYDRPDGPKRSAVCAKWLRERGGIAN